MEVNQLRSIVSSCTSSTPPFNSSFASFLLAWWFFVLYGGAIYMRAGVVKAGGAWRGKGIVGSCFPGVRALESEKGGVGAGVRGDIVKSHHIGCQNPIPTSIN